MYNTTRDITFKTTILKSNLCDYTDPYILEQYLTTIHTWTITVTRAGDDSAARRADERNKVVIFKICAPCAKCISIVNGTEVDTSKDIGIVMPMYNLIDYSDN